MRNAIRKIANWLRDDSRDALADALNASGVGATMTERGRHEEAFKRQGSSLGLIDITQGPVKWILVCFGHPHREGLLWSAGATGGVVLGQAEGIPNIRSRKASGMEGEWRRRWPNERSFHGLGGGGVLQKAG